MELLETLAKAGVLVLLGVILTVWGTRANGRDTFKVALRQVENAEEEALKKWGNELRARENEIHEQEIALIQQHLADCKSELEVAKKETAKWKQIAESQPKQTTHRK